MNSKIFNLFAAIFCAASSAVCVIAAFLSEPTLVNNLLLGAALLGTLGGVIWIIAAIMDLRGK